MKLLSYSLFVCFVFLSCGGDGTKLSSHTFPAEGWSSQDKVTFESMNITADSGIYLRVIYTYDYGYENLYINLAIDNEEPKIISVSLMDDMGRWKGVKSGDDYLYDHDISHEASTFTNTISIEQYSRDPILEGIKGIQLVQKP